MTVLVVVPVMLPTVALSELAMLPVGVQDLAAQVGTVVKVPLAAHVVSPPPKYPVSQVTVMISVVVPVILPAVALLELAMLPVGVQELAEHINVLNKLLAPQVTIPLSEYPVLQTTAVVCPVVPVWVHVRMFVLKKKKYEYMMIQIEIYLYEKKKIHTMTYL